MIPAEKVTDIAAGAALASPIWLPALHTASELAGLIVPILGALWLAVQIVIKLHQVYRRQRP